MDKKSKPLSLYIHFPFCTKKCRYCDFYSISTASETIEPYINALKTEWEQIKRKYLLENTVIRTIYCGGGTPSLLSVEQWQLFCAEIIENLTITNDAERTIECNPDSFSTEKAETWLDSGVNRITIGVQSLNKRGLTALGRVHTAENALDVLSNPALKRFDSVGVDIMYGIPGQSLNSLAYTLEEIFSYKNIHHLSAYELTIEKYTPFGRHSKLLPLPSEDSVAEMTQLILSESRKHGFERYEISNYSKPGFECRHNMAYWDHSPYIGLGAAAHSYIDNHRYANVKSVDAYIQKCATGELPAEFSETINLETLAREMIFLRLRTREGLDENRFQKLTGRTFTSPEREKRLAELAEAKYLDYTPPFWRLTDSGMLIADAVTRRLL